MQNECEALLAVAYPGFRDNRNTLNTEIRYDDDDESCHMKSNVHVYAGSVLKCNELHKCNLNSVKSYK